MSFGEIYIYRLLRLIMADWFIDPRTNCHHFVLFALQKEKHSSSANLFSVLNFAGKGKQKESSFRFIGRVVN